MWKRIKRKVCKSNCVKRSSAKSNFVKGESKLTNAADDDAAPLIRFYYVFASSGLRFEKRFDLQ